MIRIALAGCLAAAPSIAAERPALLCGGVEPFWSLEIGGVDAAYSDPETAEISYSVADVRIAEGRNWPQALTLLSPRDTGIALVRPMPCSDTASDHEFAWTIDFLTQRKGAAVVYTGCCREAE